MLGTHFTPDQLIPLLLAGIVLVASIFVFQKHSKAGLVLLVLGSLMMGYFVANLNHFLVLWDEQFHALVAKNMISSPLAPMLYSDPVIDYDYTKWTSNNIWLHKQPLFLWQMALSIKFFGANELAVRIPSIIMHAIIPLFIYKIGSITLRKEVGFIAAFIFSVSYFPLELIVGRFATDHNDIAFLFYVTGSFWAWFEYQRSKKLKYLILIGIFSGGAMLVKWLMGSLVYVIWIFSALLIHKLSFFSKNSILPIIKAGLMSLCLFLPWQIYVLLRFPKESSHELAFNGEHFFNALEGHEGDSLFHFKAGLSNLYGAGDFIPFILIIGIVVLIRYCTAPIYRVFILSTIIFVYAFFTIAATKMLSFPIIVMPFIHLGLAALIYFSIDWFSNRVKRTKLAGILLPIVLCAVGYFSVNLGDLEKNHTKWKPNENNNWEGKTIEKEFILSLNKKLPNKSFVIFNTNTTLAANIPIMFYTKHIAYMEIPTEKQVAQMKNDNRNIAIFLMGDLPEYLLKDDSIVKIKVPKLLDSIHRN